MLVTKNVPSRDNAGITSSGGVVGQDHSTW